MEVRYFVKYASSEHGKAQLEGELQSVLEINKTVAGLAPKSYAFGTMEKTSSPSFFLLSEFVNMKNGLPDPKVLGACLAKLHQKSQSPNGKFGFHVTTYDGKLPQIADWKSSLSNFFSRLLVGVAHLDADINGPWDELQVAIEQTL